MTSAESINTCDVSCSDCCKSVPILDNPYISEEHEFSLQSDLIDSSTSDGDTNIVSGIVSFDDHVAGAVVKLPDAIQSEDTRIAVNSDLQKYLSRPVNIATLTWTVGGNINTTLAPWSLYMSHPSIKRKLDNYYLFRGNLHVKFVINASPFYFGCTMVSYNPLSSFKAPEINLSAGVPNVPLSQLPRMFLYPSVSQGGSMKLPFIYHKEWLNLVSASDVTDMGTLYIRTLDVLKNANGATTPINVQVYAWVEEVELSGPTLELSLQSGKDEYGQGIISKPASAIARAANQLSTLPVIGPYATATSMVAGTMGQVAKLFGYTNVPVIEEVKDMHIAPFPKFASTDIGTPIDKLTLDSKNELTIDPKVCGADFGDELSISSIVQRESLLTDYDWQTSDLVDARLFSIAVIPTLQRTTAGVSQEIINLTPMSLVAKAFDYWRGDIEFRFKIICSQYHRGRLRFSWDPISSNLSTTTDTTTETYTKIVDIAESTDVTLRIPYMQQVAWSQCGDLVADSNLFGTNVISSSPLFSNGVLTVRVLTELTAPITASTIKVLVFVKGSENLEFANPRNIDPLNRISPYTVQSGLLAYDNEDEDISSIALQPSVPSKHIDLIYNGESIKSIRTLLRRTQAQRTSILNRAVTTTHLLVQNGSYFSRLPIYPGFDPNGVNNATAPIAAATKPYNFVPYSTLNWFGQCFLGCRGSIHWSVLNHNNNLACMTAINRPNARTTLTRALYNITPVGSVNPPLTQSIIANAMPAGAAGISITHNRTNSSNAASVPFYSQFKFRQFTPSDTTLGTFIDGSNTDGVFYTQIVPNSSVTALNANFLNGNFITTFCSAGTDFSLIFFLAVPTLYKYTAVPVAQTDP